MTRKEKIRLRIDATLELEPECLKYLDDVSLEDLEHCVLEIKEIAVAVAFERLRGTIRFVAPNSFELKKAQLEFLDSKG